MIAARYPFTMRRDAVVSIGVFDGVHQGHRAILRRGRAMADRLGCELLAVTFEPHPAAILRPDRAPPRLCQASHKTRLLLDAGADRVEVLDTASGLLHQPADRFARELADRLGVRGFVEGRDFRFGHGRTGNPAMLAQMGLERGFEVEVVDPVGAVLDDLTLVPVSSSLIRWLVGQGRVVDAARCLGRPFSLTAEVVSGERRGRTLGVPTANLDPRALHGLVQPRPGVYAATVAVGPEHDPSIHPAAVSVGTKPTFHHGPTVVEAHLIGFTGDLYGRPITVRFERWLRDQRPFPSIHALQDQLTRDLAALARLYPGTIPHPPAAATP